MPLDKELILIVDDEEMLTSVMAGFLESEGYKTLEAHNGEEALKIYQEHKSDISLILCDITMPIMNGLQMLTEGIRQYGRMPLVLLTAHQETAIVTEALRLGAIDYIVKPFEMDQLAKQVPIWIEIVKRTQPTSSDSKSAKMEGLLRVQSSRINKKIS